jgi:hypothetical protein
MTSQVTTEAFRKWDGGFSVLMKEQIVRYSQWHNFVPKIGEGNEAEKLKH